MNGWNFHHTVIDSDLYMINILIIDSHDSNHLTFWSGCIIRSLYNFKAWTNKLDITHHGIPNLPTSYEPFYAKHNWPDVDIMEVENQS